MYHDPKLVEISELILSTGGAHQGMRNSWSISNPPNHYTPAAPCRGAKDCGAGVTVRFPVLFFLIGRDRLFAR